MSPRFLLICLLSSGLLMSCQNTKVVSEGGNSYDLADNGGYSDEGFYGDSATPAAAGYPQDGQSFATSGGAPFSHYDRAAARERAVPVIPPAPAPVPPPAPVDRYASAYGQDSYAGNHGAEQAVVTPYVERVQPAPVVTSAPKVAATPKPKPKPAAKKSVASTPKKKAATTASTGSARKAGGVRTGTMVKTVYTPPGKGKAAPKKKATLVRVHDVKRGDTLSKLASRYGVTVAGLKKRNKLASDTIVVGKRLAID